MQIQNFVLLMMSKFMPVKSLKDVEIADVDYHNRQGQLEGKLILCIIINLLISVKLCIHIFIDAKLQIGLITHQKT